MKKISAAFDGLKFSEGTMQYAIKIAAESKALLSGVFLDDFLYHSYNVFDMVGEQGISAGKLKKLNENDKETRHQSAVHFENSCVEAKVNYAIHHDKSFAMIELLKESVYSDLLIIGADETVSHFDDEQPTPFVKELLAETQCPVLVVPRKFKEIEKVLLLFDGKPSSVFAIKMFNYMMPWMRGLKTEVVSVTDPTDDEELPDSVLIKEFLYCHYPEAKYTVLKGNAEEEIMTYIKRLPENVLIVLGAYQRGTVSRWFKSSMADRLIREIGEPLFIAHNK